MTQREHGGGLAAATARYGGTPEGWLDLSTGINPIPYPVPHLSARSWARLPDADAFAALEAAARRAYNVPEGLEIIPATGASALIQMMPRLAAPGRAVIVSPTYNEHAAAFRAEGWDVEELPEATDADALIVVSPNNPNGRVWRAEELSGLAELTIIDESFVDPTPEASLQRDLPRGGVILRSFGKFYGLAGLRLGFAITAPPIAARIQEMLGPWAVSGPALEIAAKALCDENWADKSRLRLAADAARMRDLLRASGMEWIGGTSLFITMQTPNAPEIAERLARAHILVRQFSYAPDWLRFGLPGDEAAWARLERAL